MSQVATVKKEVEDIKSLLNSFRLKVGDFEGYVKELQSIVKRLYAHNVKIIKEKRSLEKEVDELRRKLGPA